MAQQRRQRVVVWACDGVLAPYTGYGRALADPLRAAGFEVRVVSLTRRRPTPAELAVDRHVLSGGDTCADSGVAWMRETRQLLAPVAERALAGTATVVGVCLGSQLLATHLAGAGVAGPSPHGMQAGLHVVRATADGAGPRHDVPAGELVVAEFHHHEVDHRRLTAAGAVVTLGDGHSPVQGWRAGRGVHGLQFHPEVGPDLLAATLRHHRPLLRATGAEPRRALDTVAALRHAWDPATFRRLVVDRLLAPLPHEAGSLTPAA